MNWEFIWGSSMFHFQRLRVTTCHNADPTAVTVHGMWHVQPTAQSLQGQGYPLNKDLEWHITIGLRYPSTDALFTSLQKLNAAPKRDYTPLKKLLSFDIWKKSVTSIVRLASHTSIIISCIPIFLKWFCLYKCAMNPWCLTTYYYL